MASNNQANGTKGKMMEENRVNPDEIPCESESLEEDKSPQLLCEVFQCRHWTPFEDPNAVAGRCPLPFVAIGQKSLTRCEDGVIRWIDPDPDLACSGFEYIDRYRGTQHEKAKV